MEKTVKQNPPFSPSKSWEESVKLKILNTSFLQTMALLRRKYVTNILTDRHVNGQNDILASQYIALCNL